MSAFRFGALRDLFARSDPVGRAKSQEQPQLDGPEQADEASTQAQAAAERKQEVEDKLARAVRKPSPGSETYTAADIEVLEGLEPVRRRPGMYVGGTDERALHHLFAEVIDNAMDEAVAGHANWIEVSLEADGFLCVSDNGRGIPIDPHPKFKSKS